MKKRKLILIIIAILCTSIIKAEKRALLVAIGDYPVESGWRKINAQNDIDIIKPGLIKQGFPERNITVLLNEQATKLQILKAFDELIEKTQKGDIVFFLFAGHGQQVTDISGDEIDGWDEALIPYDAYKWNLTNEKSASKHLIDDELNLLILQLREKAGISGDVLVCIDACHSGTINRSPEDTSVVFRGTEKRYIIPEYEDKKSDIIKKDSYIDQVQYKNVQNSSPFIVISACAAEQENKEYKDIISNKNYGSLSYIIATLFSKNISDMSYISFFESLKIEMSNLGVHYRLRQFPQMEGYANRKIFAGKAVSIPKHFTIERYNSKNKTVVINGGSLAGIKSGAIIDFYLPDTYNVDKSKSMQTATVVDVGLVESILKLSPSSNEINQKSWAVVSKYTFSKEKEKEERAQIIRQAKSVKKEAILEIIPLDINGKPKISEVNPKSKNIVFSPNEAYDVKITNMGDTPLYFQLINISADNEIKLVNIKVTGTKFDYYIESKDSKIIELKIDSDTKTGLETLVLVAYKEALELSTIETETPKANRFGINEFEDFLNEIYNNERSYKYVFKDISIDSKSFYVR